MDGLGQLWRLWQIWPYRHIGHNGHMAIVAIDAIADPDYRYGCLMKRLDIRIEAFEANFV